MLALSMEYDINMARIDNYFESAVLNYINDMNFAFMVTETSHDMDDLNVLCIEAGGQLVQKIKNAFDAIIETIKNFIKNTREKIDMKNQKSKIDRAMNAAKRKSIRSVKKDFSSGKYTVNEAEFKIQSIQMYYTEYNKIIRSILELSAKIKNAGTDDDLSKYKTMLEEYFEQLKHAIKLEKIAISADINKNIQCAESDLTKIEKILSNISADAEKNIGKIYEYAEAADDDNDGVPNPSKVKLLKQCATLTASCAKLSSQAVSIVTRERINALNKAIEEIPDKVEDIKDKIEDKKEEIRDKIEDARDRHEDKKDAREDKKWDREAKRQARREERKEKRDINLGMKAIKKAL